MGRVKELYILEEAMFNIRETLHHNLNFKNKTQYCLALEVMEELNNEYFELAGEYYIDQLTLLGYYEQKWSTLNA